MHVLKPLEMANSPNLTTSPGPAPLANPRNPARPPLAAGPAGASPAALGHAAEQFEAMFIRQMLHEMDQATRELAAADSPLRDPVSGDLRDYANMAFADSLAKQHAFGIATLLVRQLTPPAPAPAALAPLHRPA